MKKLIGLSVLALGLAACSPHHNAHKHQGYDAHHKNSELAAAIKACHTPENMKDMQAFEGCLKAKGFEKPANHPTMYHGHKHHNPELAKAMKECHKVVKSKMDTEKFESCLKDKGFVKPAHHPKVMAH